MENIEKGYICILADSQGTIKALDCSRWIPNQCETAISAWWNWQNNRIELVWVLGHVGIDGNETADQLARQVSAIPLTGP